VTERGRQALPAIAAAFALALPGAGLPMPAPAMIELCGGGIHRLDVPIPGDPPREDCRKACHAFCERSRRARTPDGGCA
jgi:hypothetical protein